MVENDNLFGDLFDEDTTKSTYFDGKLVESKPTPSKPYLDYDSGDTEKMCRRDTDRMSRGDYYTTTERDNTGGSVDKTYFSDGSSITHHGGPCGPSYSDEYGREC